MRSDLDLARTSLTNVRQALLNEENKCQNLVIERDKLNQNLLSNQSATNELELLVKRLESDKDCLCEVIKRKDEENERIVGELRELQEEMRSTRSMKSDLLTQMEEIKTEKNLLEVN